MRSQIKDTKHIRREFHSVAWIMPQGWDLGRCGCPGGQKIYFFKHGHVVYQIDGDDEQNRMQVKFSPLPCGEVKQSNIIKFQLQGQFQRLLYKSLRVFSQIKDRKHIERNFHSVAWVMPQGWDLGKLGGFALAINCTF